MQSRSSTLVASAFILTALTTETTAQTTSPVPKVGYIRFWNMLPPANGAFDLRKVVGTKSDAVLFENTVSYRYSSYREFPVGKYQLALHQKGDATRPLRLLTVDLKPDSYFTIVISPGAPTANVELVDDTIDVNESSGTLIVRNFFPGVTVAVSSGSQNIVEALPYGQSFRASGLAPERLPLSIKTQLPNGTPAESGAEADLRVSKHATLLIIPDSYGRFRPRVTVDGKN